MSLGNLKFFTYSLKKCQNHLKNLSVKKRKELCKQLNFPSDWVKVDQSVPDFRKQLITKIINETQRVHNFLHTSLKEDKCLTNFLQAKSSIMNFKSGYWMARGPRVCAQWVKRSSKVFSNNFSSVVHFVQIDNGTGVCISKNGLILTCAHVIAHGDDDNDEIIGKQRKGREKVIMFPDGDSYRCTCIDVFESENGKEDLALMKIIQKKPESFPHSNISQRKKINLHEKIFCIGNPSNLDLESERQNDKLNLCPRVWHFSHGIYKGYSPKYGLGGMKHLCWTYWGHSGAPLFDKNGDIIGIHSSWDSLNGMRHAISLDVIQKFVKPHLKQK